MQEPARVAIDLGAESCRVSLLRWVDGKPAVEVIHRIPNGPKHRGAALYWPLEQILAGLEEGLRKAAAIAPEGIASIGVDSWSVDYVRLAPDGSMLREPFCYRDERTVKSKQAADAIISPFDIYQRTGAYPLNLNTVYQLMADPAAGVDGRAPWVMFPEFVLYWLSGRRVGEYTNASHTGLVNLKTGTWDAELFEMLGLAVEAAPPMVPTGTVLGPIKGPLAGLDAFRATANNCAGHARYGERHRGDCQGSEFGGLHQLGHVVAGGHCYANAGDYAARLRCRVYQHWRGGRRTAVSLAHQQHVGAEAVHGLVGGGGAAMEDRGHRPKGCCMQCHRGVLDMDAPTLMLDSGMPERINSELTRLGFDAIPDVAGNEPLFARTIFESLALRYASALANLEKMLGRKLDRIHMIGGATRNKLLIELTEKQTGLKVEIGETESSTVGSLAIQLAASEAVGKGVTPAAIRKWAEGLCRDKAC